MSGCIDAVGTMSRIRSFIGLVIGATILVYLLTVILSQIEFIPILGEWAASLIEQIEKFDK